MITAYPIDKDGNKNGNARQFDEGTWSRIVSQKACRWVKLEEPKQEVLDYDTYFTAAKTAENEGDRTAALDLFEKAYKIKPSNYLKGKINKWKKM